MLDDLPVGDSPDDNPAKLDSLSRLPVSGCPMVAHHDFVVFCDHSLNLHMRIGKARQRSTHILDARRPGGTSTNEAFFS